MIDWPTLINDVVRYAPEVLLVVIFMVYEERQQTRHDTTEAARLKQRIESDEKRDQAWQVFLQEERDQRREDAMRTDHLLTTLATAVGSTLDLLKMHDAWERQVQGQRRTVDKGEGK